MTDFHKTHYCPTCKSDFDTNDTTSAHHRTYMHLKNIHSMRVHMGCHVNCIYIKPPAKPKRTRAKKVEVNGL